MSGRSSAGLARAGFVLLLLGLGSCNFKTEADKREEEQLKKIRLQSSVVEMTRDRKDLEGITVEECSLVKEVGNRYTGWVDLSGAGQKKRLPVTVTVDSDVIHVKWDFSKVGDLDLLRTPKIGIYPYIGLSENVVTVKNEGNFDWGNARVVVQQLTKGSYGAMTKEKHALNIPAGQFVKVGGFSQGGHEDVVGYKVTLHANGGTYDPVTVTKKLSEK